MFARLEDLEIFFDVSGSHFGIEGTGLVERPTIIAIHGGLGFDHGYLKPALDQFRDEAQVILVDLRGHGRSSRPPLEACGLEEMADDIAALCTRLGIRRPILFGHSAGGFVALHTVLRHPGLVGGLVLCNSAATRAPVIDEENVPEPTLASRATPEALAVAMRLSSGDLTEETVSAFATIVAPYYAAPDHMAFVTGWLALSTLNQAMLRHFLRSLGPSYDVRMQLGAINVPTLILSGSHDWACTPGASRLLAREIPAATLIRFEESGHFPFHEEPRKFKESVLAFIREYRSGARSDVDDQETYAKAM
jgi:proline iminopeptidase